MANLAFREAEFETLAALRNLPLVQENLRPARRHLLAARAACPLLSRVDLNLAMLTFLDQDNPAGIADLERAAALAPVDEDLQYTAGVIAEQAARPEMSERFWQRSLSLGTKHQSEILNSVLGKRPFTEIIERVLPASPAVLLDLARTQFSGKPHDSERRLLVERARHLLATGSSNPASAEQLYWSGVVERMSGQNNITRKRVSLRARTQELYDQRPVRRPNCARSRRGTAWKDDQSVLRQDGCRPR